MSDETAVERPAFDYAAVKKLTGGALAEVVLECIEENRDRWYQGAWRQDLDPDNGAYLQPCTNVDLATATVLEAFAEDPLNPACTTSFCFAGWVGALKGVKWAKGDQESIGDPKLCDCTSPCCTDGHHQIALPAYARRELEITGNEGDHLFNGDNDIWALRRMVEQLANGGTIYGVDDSDGDDDDDD